MTALLLALVAWIAHPAPLAQPVATTTEAGGAPARIVSLAPSVTETLFALGVGSRVVAVSDYCDYPPEVRRLPKIGSFLDPSVEAIVAQRPDVVIGVPSPGNHEAVEALRRLIADESGKPYPITSEVIRFDDATGFSVLPASAANR